MKILIVYPHGLGDCILATPAIEAYKMKTGDFIGFAMLERFKSAQLFAHNPHIDEIVYTKDAWNDYISFVQGLSDIMGFCKRHAKEKKYDKIILVRHSAHNSKILDCFKALEIEPEEEILTRVYLSDQDYEWADKAHSRYLSKIGIIHSKTGVADKDLPEGYGKKWLNKYFPNLHPLELGDRHGQPVTRCFALLKLADAVCVADSVYYHAAGAMNKNIDLAYFARGESCYNRVKPLAKVKQNIVYKLEEI